MQGHFIGGPHDPDLSVTEGFPPVGLPDLWKVVKRYILRGAPPYQLFGLNLLTAHYTHFPLDEAAEMLEDYYTQNGFLPGTDTNAGVDVAALKAAFAVALYTDYHPTDSSLSSDSRRNRMLAVLERTLQQASSSPIESVQRNVPLVAATMLAIAEKRTRFDLDFKAWSSARIVRKVSSDESAQTIGDPQGSCVQLLVYDRSWGQHPEHEQIVKELKDEVSPIFEVSPNDVDCKATDIGRGSNEAAILLAITALFLAGKQINENLDAWISIGKKFVALIKTLNRRFGRCRIDEHGATLLCIERIVAEEDITSLEKVQEYVIPVSPILHKPSEYIDSRPDSIYVQVYHVRSVSDAGLAYVFIVKSDGKIETQYRFYL